MNEQRAKSEAALQKCLAIERLLYSVPEIPQDMRHNIQTAIDWHFLEVTTDGYRVTKDGQAFMERMLSYERHEG